MIKNVNSFDDLVFTPYIDREGRCTAHVFDNGYAISIIGGGKTLIMGDGVLTFEVGILYKEQMCFDTPLKKGIHVFPYMSKHDINQLIVKLKNL